MSDEAIMFRFECKKLIESLGPKVTRRRAITFAAACCERLRPHVRTDAGKQLLRAVDRAVDKSLSEEELREVWDAFDSCARELVSGRRYYGERDAHEALRCAALVAFEQYDAQTLELAPEWERLGSHLDDLLDLLWLAEVSIPAAVLDGQWDDRARTAYARCSAEIGPRVDHEHEITFRCVFGGTVSEPAVLPEWRTDTAVALARTMYERREFSAMPILADALQDAGCDSDDILNHCRDVNQPHVRGCWVVDLVLGKE